ncbi:hypothetical protein RUM43_012988, partial [Polyplax serrata]
MNNVDSRREGKAKGRELGSFYYSVNGGNKLIKITILEVEVEEQSRRGERSTVVLKSRD